MIPRDRVGLCDDESGACGRPFPLFSTEGKFEEKRPHSPTVTPV